MSKVLLIALHGVEFGEIKSDFANVLFNGIRDNLSESQCEKLITIPYNWTHYTNERQMQMFNSVEKGLWNQNLRKYKHTIGSDVTWTVGRAKQGTKRFIDDIKFELSSLIEVNLKKYPDAKIVLFGHSQGSQVAFNFIFDYQGTIDCLITAGSPISMNSGMFDDWGKIPKNLKQFVNFYNKADFVSSKLQSVHPSEEISNFVKDYEVPLPEWKPCYWKYNLKSMKLIGALKSHLIYWESDFVHKTIASLIKEF
jgi:hypothetical protein